MHRLTGLPLPGGPAKWVIGVTITTVARMLATFLTRPTDQKILMRFYKLVDPGGSGWKRLILEAKEKDKDFEKFANKKSTIGRSC